MVRLLYFLFILWVKKYNLLIIFLLSLVKDTKYCQFYCNARLLNYSSCIQSSEINNYCI